MIPSACQSGRWEGSGGGGEPGMYAFFRSTSCPTGWVKANGSNGTVDLRGQFVRAWDNGRGIDSGRSLGTYQGDAIRNITGNISHGRAWGPVTNGAFQHSSQLFDAPTGSNWANGIRTTFDASRVVPTANENRPKNVALLACMKS